MHARTVAELLAIARPGCDYLALDEDGRIALLLEELATPRPLTAPGVAYSDETRGELAIFHTAQSIHRRYGKAAIENVIISKTDGVSDMLEVAVLLKEVGLLRPLEHALDVNIVRSAAAAAPATRPSSPSRRARCRARSASPNRAR